MHSGKWLIVFAFMVICIGMSTTQEAAASCGPYAPAYTTNNNFTMLDPTGAVAGGTNDVTFTWDGTLKTSVAVSGQVSNATIASACSTATPTVIKSVHDVAVYGPGTYTVYAGCAPKAPNCTGTARTNPITFTVGAGEIGVHALLDFGVGTLPAASKNVDVVNVWTKSSVFTPSTMYTGACGSNSADTVWGLMSKATSTINGYPMVDGPYAGSSVNLNIMGAPIVPVLQTANNNFTMNQPGGTAFGGTNDVCFSWDGTKKTSVAISGQVSNATLSSSCAFFGQPWWARDMVIYGPGTYTVYTGCPAGSPGCGIGVPYTFTVNPGELGSHMLFLWNGNDNIDVVDVWKQGSYDQGIDLNTCLPTPSYSGSSPMWTGACGTGVDTTVWDWMSYDWDNDCINGAPMVDGPFQGMHANFNVMGMCLDCGTANCDDNNACTIDAFNPATGMCAHTQIVCDDNNICTSDTCNTATGCVYTRLSGPPGSCDDGDPCTIDDRCDLGFCQGTPLNCDDNNACTTNDVCTNGTCGGIPVVCPAPAVCKAAGVCQPATGTCTYANLADGTSCDDGLFCDGADACSGGTCSVHSGNLCVYPYVCVEMLRQCERTECSVDADCNDRNVCTTDTCYPTELPYVNVCGHPLNNTICPSTTGNNFTMIDSNNTPFGGTNDVVFSWDGTKRTSVGQPPNALISSYCPFFGLSWAAHDVTVYGPGTYTICSGCPAGSPGCGIGPCITFTVKTGEIGIHMLFDWNGSTNIDVVNVMKPNAIFPSLWTGGCGSNAACTVWAWSSYDPDGDGIPGFGMVDGPFQGISANFNLNKVSVDMCCDAATRCDDGNACTTDTCNPATGACSNTAISCDDGNACTADSCDPATGCVHTAISCDDSNTCTADSCDTVKGCQHTAIGCDDNNACTADSCDPVTGCQHAPISCDDNNACTSDSCDTVLGCQHLLITCNPIDACHTASCDAVQGCQQTPKANCCLSNTDCNDSNVCTTDVCNLTTNTCTYAAIANCCNTDVECADGIICTTDTCVNHACVHTWIPGSCTSDAACNDGNACTLDTCVNCACKSTPIPGCCNTDAECKDNNVCTTDACNVTTHTCTHAAIANCCTADTDCNDGKVCTADTCNTATNQCSFTAIPGCITCSAGQYTTVTLTGGGQNPNTVDEQIQTSFTVVNHSGCILSYTKSTVTASVNTILEYNPNIGNGPQPSSCTLNSAAFACGGTHQITLSTTGTAGKLVLDNKAAGGSDTDRITVSAQ